MSSFNEELLDLFFTETNELFSQTEGALWLFVEGNHTQKEIESIHHLAHTIKESAMLMELNALSAFAQTLERIMMFLRDGKLKYNSEICVTVLKGFDILKAYANGLQQSSSYKPKLTDINSELSKLLDLRVM